jgi:hypothetical protein
MIRINRFWIRRRPLRQLHRRILDRSGQDAQQRATVALTLDSKESLNFEPKGATFIGTTGECGSSLFKYVSHLRLRLN